ncbi:MAG: ABC transporter ATP-binding protein [Caldilineales bacterium]|nr:ABC transporter ATP-binding protein [Caldilineales bacterium]
MNKPTAPPVCVDLQHVSLRYVSSGREVHALEDVSLSIGQGEFVAVAGPSGCGKTTILKLVAGLLPPTQGRVLIDGHPVSGPQKNVGMAFQNPILLPWRTALQNVLLPLEVVQPHRGQFRSQRRAYEERAHSLLHTVGLDGFADKPPYELSGGMQQRVSLCRALIHEPEILLLDEPFAALDAFTREELWSVLQALWTERRCTVILVTHDLREAVFLATRVHIMSKRPGRLIHETLIDLPRPRALEDTFKPEFVDYVHSIYGRIGQVRA